MKKRTEAGALPSLVVTAALVAGAGCPSEIGEGARAAVVDDTGTLRIEVRIAAMGGAPGDAEGAQVALAVSVVERSTGQPVTDAVVTATAAGRRPVTLPYDVYSLSTYAASSRGYAARWELSIERRGDHVRGLALDAPTFPTLAVALQPAPGRITWAPARERGVTSVVCATIEGAASVGQRCVDGDDEGALGVGVGAGVSMFPVDATYWIALVRARRSDLGALGAAVVETAVGERHTATP